MKLFRLLVLFFALCMPLFANAVMFCSEPRIPTCLSLGMGFSNQSDFDMCKMEMTFYQKRVKEYRDCLDQEIQETINRYNKAVEKFNCYARGNSFCP